MEIDVNLGDHKYFGGLINVDSMQQKQEMMKGLMRNKSQIQFYQSHLQTVFQHQEKKKHWYI